MTTTGRLDAAAGEAGSRMALTDTGSHRVRSMVSICTGVGVLSLIFTMILDPLSPYTNTTGFEIAVPASVLVAAGGVALATVIRMISGTSARLERWVRRSWACALLLTPAALALTRTFNAGSDVSDCGTLLARYRPAGPQMAGFQAECNTAADDRLILVLVWLVAGCLVAGVCGLWLRHRQQRAATRRAV